MRIAIVGASKPTFNEERDAQQFCGLMMNQWIKEFDNLEIVSGGAKGIDTVAVDTARGLGIKCKVFVPEVPNWEGYKARNLKIAEYCDQIYCLPASLKKTKCYHCNEPHERSGGCWTAKKVKEMGKLSRVIPPTR